LGHIQRGGTPTAIDRVWATRMGSAAVDLLLQGHCDVMVGSQGENLIRLELSDILGKKKTVNQSLIDLTKLLSN
jgi:6-phosphofructokinase 1